MHELMGKIRAFVHARDWQQYHSPKNLAMGLSVETSELLEVFTWLTEQESRKLSDKQLGRAKEEIGDIMIFLLNLCDQLGIDPVNCAHSKLDINEAKYPVNKAYGSAKKYDDN